MKEICGIEIKSMPGGWKTIKYIPGFRGRYYASRDGRIFSRRKLKDGTFSEKELKQTPHPSGYLQVRLSKNGKSQTHFVHRLVAATHLSNPKGYSCIRHRDGIKHHNFVANLQWVSHTLAQRSNEEAEELRKLYADRAEEIVMRRRRRDMTASEITAFEENQLDLKTTGPPEWMIEGESVSEIARALELPRSQVSYCVQRWFWERDQEKSPDS